MPSPGAVVPPGSPRQFSRAVLGDERLVEGFYIRDMRYLLALGVEIKRTGMGNYVIEGTTDTLLGSCDWLSANQGPVFPGSVGSWVMGSYACSDTVLLHDGDSYDPTLI